MEHIITNRRLLDYANHLHQKEHASGTIQKYLRDVRHFSSWLSGKPVTKESVAQWKEQLYAAGKKPETVNGYLSSLNSFLDFAGWQECRVRCLKVQRRLFREAARELEKGEFFRLVAAARAAKDLRLALLLETICATGIRVSELRYITLEAARSGRADISLKGKIRTILLPGKLSRKLIQYAQKQKIASGEIFLTRSGKGLSRGQIWAQMKGLCQQAGVDAHKVFPHNLRHLFARGFYKACRDIVKLADVLGHSAIETTRLYLISTGEEHARQLEKLGFIT